MKSNIFSWPNGGAPKASEVEGILPIQWEVLEKWPS